VESVKFKAGKEIKQFLGKRKKDVSKTDFGHLLIIAGSKGMSGAAVLSARASLRVGIGLVTIGCPESIYPIIAAQMNELMTLPLPETKTGSIGFLAFSKISEFISRRKVSVLAVGPGLTTHPETSKLVFELLSLETPIVLDADGINALATTISNSKLQIPNLVKSTAKIIITPHPGEFARLINVDKEKIQKNRVYYAKNFAQENKVICVLKGCHTVITDGQGVFINPTGNPGMATAGSGDVLTGMIAGLISQVQAKSPALACKSGVNSEQRAKLLNAAKLGVYLHGLAGDLAAREKTEMGLIAGDIIEKIPEAIKAVKGVRCKV
jgi:NAD(P)H-hydrate epimerase